MVAKEGISVNIVAGFGVKPSQQNKESPQQDILLPKVTWKGGFPSPWEEEPHSPSRNTSGKERRAIENVQLSPLPRNKEPSLPRNSPTLLPWTLCGAHEAREDTAHRPQAGGSLTLCG